MVAALVGLSVLKVAQRTLGTHCRSNCEPWNNANYVHLLSYIFPIPFGTRCTSRSTVRRCARVFRGQCWKTNSTASRNTTGKGREQEDVYFITCRHFLADLLNQNRAGTHVHRTSVGLSPRAVLVHVSTANLVSHSRLFLHLHQPLAHAKDLHRQSACRKKSFRSLGAPQKHSLKCSSLQSQFWNDRHVAGRCGTRSAPSLRQIHVHSTPAPAWEGMQCARNVLSAHAPWTVRFCATARPGNRTTASLWCGRSNCGEMAAASYGLARDVSVGESQYIPT